MKSKAFLPIDNCVGPCFSLGIRAGQEIEVRKNICSDTFNDWIHMESFWKYCADIHHVVEYKVILKRRFFLLQEMSEFANYQNSD